MGQSDADLAVRAQAGDTDAFALLAERHAPVLAALAYARIGDADAARDIAQETLLEAYESLRSLRCPERFGAWARRIAVNQSVSWIRRRQRERREREERGAAPEAALSFAPPPEAAAIRREEQARLLAALGRLDETSREILLLRFTEGLTRAEAAAVLEIEPEAADKRLQRARARLRQEMGPDAE